MTAVIYARYSSDNQREESIEGQIRECTAYAEKNDITIVKHYIDRAISAKTDNRPQFQQMIKDSDKKLFDIVLVWKLDRFARNRYDSARYKTQLKKNGVKLMSATEIISEGPEGIILESVLEGYAEYYSADLAEKVVRGQTENILKGRCNGGRGTFGYTLDSERKFHIDPLASPFVLESFTKYRDGLTMKEIRDWLNENGIKNPVGGEFTYNSVEHMLKNRRYIGELKFRDVVVPDAIPPIVPLELFDDVQEKIAKNKKAPARRKAEDDYLLTTKLHCGCCGALMFGESGTSRTGEVHRYYKCATAKKKKGCKKKTVRKQWLEDLVVNQTMQLVRDDAAMESIIAKVMELQDRENTNLPLYEKQLRDAESGIQNMLNAIQAGILTSSTKERLEQLEETKRELEARIAEEKLAKPKIKEEFIRFWLMRFRKLDMSLKDQRQALVDTFINSIYIYMPLCCSSAVGSYRYKITCKTPGGHSYANFGDPSAIQLLCGLVNELYQIQPPVRSRTTYNVGRIEGGTTVNSIAQQASMLYEFRSTAQDCLEEMEEKFRRAVAHWNGRGGDFEVELLGIRPGNGPVDQKRLGQFTAKSKEIVRTFTGREPDETPNSTDSNIPLSLGIPANTIGTIDGGSAHTRQEWVDIASLPTGLKIVLGLMLEYQKSDCF